MYRAMVLAGDVMCAVAELLPGRNNDWLDRDYDAAVARTALEVAEDGGEALEPGWTTAPPRVVDALGPDERDAQWVSKWGGRWRWAGDRWEAILKGSDGWDRTPVGYTPHSTGPFTEIVAQPPMDWLGWAVPAILEVLAEHEWFAATKSCQCQWPGEHRGWPMTHRSWREHVAPLIAERLACDPQRAAEALSRYKPQ